jgi:UDP-glucuronate 4-epimerase
MKTILVTGCAGFIGSNLSLSLLKKGNKVIGIDNFDSFYSKSLKEANLEKLKGFENFEFLPIDITDKQAYNLLNPALDLVVHLAAKAGVLPSLKDPDAYIKTNIIGTNILLEWMNLNNVKKMVFASSSSVYGNNKKVPFAEEDTVNEQISPYAFTKRACELMNYNYHYLYHFDIVNLRFFTVYGPSQRPDLAINKFFSLIKQNKTIEMYGDGTTARDYTYIDDIVSGIEGAIDYVLTKNSVYEIVNLGNNSPVSLHTLVHSIYEVLDKMPNTINKPMQPGDVNVTYADISKAKKLFGYSPTTQLKDGLIKFNEWHDIH